MKKFLIVKGTAEQAQAEAEKRGIALFNITRRYKPVEVIANAEITDAEANAWLTDGAVNPPFPAGTLLFWRG